MANQKVVLFSNQHSMRKLSFLLFLLLSSLFLPLQAQQAYNMQFHSNWDDNSIPNRSGVYFNDIWGYAANGREYAIMGSTVGTIFFDVTIPQTPIEVARINGGYPLSLWRDFKTYRSFAYGVADETSASNRSGLQIFDLSDLPNSVSKVYDSFVFFETAHNIFINEDSGRLYVVGSNTRRNGIIVLDISVNPAAPTLLASVNLPGGYIHDVYVRNDTAYCSHGNNGLYIYDLRYPTTPVQLGALTSYPNSGYNHSSWLTEDGDHLIFADETHNRYLKVLDVSDPGNLSIVGTIKSTLLAPSASNSIAHNPFIKGDSVYISYYHEGVQIYDITDPTLPVNVSYYDTEPSNTNYNGYKGTWGVYPFLPSGNIIASDVARGLFVVTPVTPVFSLGGVNLEAEAQEQEVQLRWQDDEFSEFVGFEIERAAPGEAFETILQTQMVRPGHFYEMADKMPLAGEANYRLLALDAAGNHFYSQELLISFQYTSNRISIYPNPASAADGITLRLGRQQDGMVGIKLLSANGQVLFTQQIQLESGSSEYDLNLSDYATGIYFLLIQDEQGQYAERIQIR